MKTPEQVRDEAAEVHMNRREWEKFSEPYAHILSFKSGYDYAVKNDPRVLDLISVLKDVDEWMQDRLAYDESDTMDPTHQEVVRVLKTWEGEHDKG